MQTNHHEHRPGGLAAPSLPDAERLLRLDDVLQRVGLGRTKWFGLVRAGIAPRPIKIGRAVAWPATEVQAFIRSSIEASRGGAR